MPVLFTFSLQTIFEMSSFTRSKDVTGDPKCTRVTMPTWHHKRSARLGPARPGQGQVQLEQISGSTPWPPSPVNSYPDDVTWTSLNTTDLLRSRQSRWWWARWGHSRRRLRSPSPRGAGIWTREWWRKSRGIRRNWWSCGRRACEAATCYGTRCRLKSTLLL